MSNTISTADPLPVGTIITIGGEWLRVTGEVDHLTYTVDRITRARQWRIRAQNALRSVRSVWRTHIWWPVTDRAEDAWTHWQRAKATR